MAKKSKAKARKRVATKDLAPKDAKAVKGGKVTLSDIQFVKNTDKASPVLLN